jgi:hypothetical protein
MRYKGHLKVLDSIVQGIWFEISIIYGTKVHQLTFYVYQGIQYQIPVLTVSEISLFFLFYMQVPVVTWTKYAQSSLPNWSGEGSNGPKKI